VGVTKMQNETKFKMKVQSRLSQIPGVWHVKIQQVALRGVPDMLICYKGKFFAWELKTLKGRVSDLQRYVLNNITKAGGIARVVTPDNLDECIEELLNG
jgi:hypothetical protein